MLSVKSAAIKRCAGTPHAPQAVVVLNKLHAYSLRNRLVDVCVSHFLESESLRSQPRTSVKRINQNAPARDYQGLVKPMKTSRSITAAEGKLGIQVRTERRHQSETHGSQESLVPESADGPEMTAALAEASILRQGSCRRQE